MLEMDPFYINIIFLAVSGMAAYIAILYMASKFLGRPQLTAYANVELNQLIASIAILVMAFFAWNFAIVFSNAVSGADAGNTPIDISVHFLTKVVDRGVLPTYFDLVRTEVVLSYFNSLEYRMGPGVWNWTTKAVPGLEPILSVVRMLIFTYTALYGTLSIQIVIFRFIDVFMYSYFLPAGVVLRFFPPTRDAGVFLIVMAIAFQCFFPMLYAINSHALDEMWSLHGWSDGYDPQAEDLSYSQGIRTLANPVLEFGNDVSQFLPIFQPFSFLTFLPTLDRVAQISLAALFLPAFSMGLTIAFINATTKFITGKG
jgi:hypothetical protein